MLTALIHANATPGALASTLSSLVPGVAEGLVSHAVVIMPDADPASERIADAMGASVIIAASDHWQAAARTARGDWVLLLEAGETPGQGWIGAVERHLMQQSTGRQRPALLAVAGPMAGLRERLAMLTGAGRPRAGVIVPRLSVAEGCSGGVPVRLGVRREPMPK
jgi:hypothetical protein